MPHAKQAEMKKSYYSCIQYVDHLVGVLLSALKAHSLYEDTTIIFWGDRRFATRCHGGNDPTYTTRPPPPPARPTGLMQDDDAARPCAHINIPLRDRRTC